jgi:predicted phage terminase large subunit-like protein
MITLAGSMDGTGYRGKEPTVSAYGMESNLVGSHFTFGILDDMVNRDNINTREQLDKPINFFKDALDLIDPINGRKQVIVIGTTWHQSDLYSWIEDEESGVGQDFAILKLPAYEGEWGKGKLLFPTRLGWEQLEELKRSQGSSHFAAQYLLNPVPREDALFKFDFKYYEDTDLTGLDLNKFIAVDPALSDKKSADYSAMVCVGVDKNNSWYILDIWRDKVNPSRLIDQIFYWDEKWKPVTIGMETVAFQKILQFSINDEMRKRNRFIPIKELTHHDKSKDERIRGLEPRYETGTVFHKKELPENSTLEDELRRFPRGKNDDVIDALASILEISYPPRKRMERRRFSHSDYPA